MVILATHKLASGVMCSLILVKVMWLVLLEEIQEYAGGLQELDRASLVQVLEKSQSQGKVESSESQSFLESPLAGSGGWRSDHVVCHRLYFGSLSTGVDENYFRDSIHVRIGFLFLSFRLTPSIGSFESCPAVMFLINCLLWIEVLMLIINWELTFSTRLRSAIKAR